MEKPSLESRFSHTQNNFHSCALLSPKIIKDIKIRVFAIITKLHKES